MKAEFSQLLIGIFAALICQFMQEIWGVKVLEKIGLSQVVQLNFVQIHFFFCQIASQELNIATDKRVIQFYINFENCFFYCQIAAHWRRNSEEAQLKKEFLEMPKRKKSRLSSRTKCQRDRASQKASQGLPNKDDPNHDSESSEPRLSILSALPSPALPSPPPSQMTYQQTSMGSRHSR